MSDIVIKVENIWKEYHLDVVSHHSMAKDLQSWWARVQGKEDPNAPVGAGIAKGQGVSGKRKEASAKGQEARAERIEQSGKCNGNSLPLTSSPLPSSSSSLPLTSYPLPSSQSSLSTNLSNYNTNQIRHH